jgi:hypothetical protein
MAFSSTTRISAFQTAAAFTLSLKRDRLLVTAFRSPATASALTDTIPGSMFPACYFTTRLITSRPVRLSAPRLVRFAPLRPLLCFSPLPFCYQASPASSTASTSLWDCNLPPDQSVQRYLGQLARLPVSPDFLSLPASVSISSYRTRIIVPGSLRHRRLAVPQTSWNLFHYAPRLCARQHFSVTSFTLFLRFYPTAFSWGYPLEELDCL